MQVELHKFVPAAYMPERKLTLCDIFVDSREVTPGSGYLALRGSQIDGRQFIDAALVNGAQCVFADIKGYELTSQQEKYVVNIPDLEQHIAAMAADFYDQPSLNINTIAVTGTNGKTSVCQFVAMAMSDILGPCGYMGTLGWGIKTLEPLINTTPDVVSVHRILRAMINDNARSVALEVSSHGIHQGRIDNVLVDVAVFTNLSRDHLDYHGDMESYAETKRRLFNKRGIQCAVINIDDEVGAGWVVDLRKTTRVLTYSAFSDKADVHLIAANYRLNGTQMIVGTPHGQLDIDLPVIGQFNVANLLATCAVLCFYHQDINQIRLAMLNIKSVPGRMELVGNGEPAVVVDYAHTPDGLEKALKALQGQCEGNLWLVFGCGGDRDKGKRPLMGKIAENMADRIVVTSDNPRTEAPASIISEILSGIDKPENVNTIIDRFEAISFALKNACSGDCVLIAGKGHETYQVLSTGVIEFDDRDVVRRIQAGGVK